jgi:hypothetical protein
VVELSGRECLLLAVPYDLLLHILAWLEPYDLCTLAQACSVRFSICLARKLTNSRTHTYTL